MFEGFQRKTDHHARRRFAFSTGASLVLYGLVGVAVVWAASKPEPAKAPDEVAVTFQPMPEAPPPPPPPAVPADMQVKRVKVPRPVEPLRAPEEVPPEPLPEAEPTNDAVEVADGTAGEGGGVEGGSAPAPAPAPPPPPPPPPKVVRAEPINLPEQATPPVAADDNAQPEYPSEARAKGLEGQVILKIVVSETGAVTRVEVLRGDEPFASAAMAAVKTWRYTPALVEGRPQAVFRIVKIPFRIKS